MRVPKQLEIHRKWMRVLQVSIVLLLVKVFLGILWEYRNYFPLNFRDAAFLIGREKSFTTLYGIAFYSHIISAPISLILAATLMATGKQAGWQARHRWIGKVFFVLTQGVVVPSAVIMAFWAFTGIAAGIGLAVQAFVLAYSVTQLVATARSKNFVAHKRWATRALIILLAPLVLRINVGIAEVLHYTPLEFYVANVWLTWCFPLLAYELWQRRTWTSEYPNIRSLNFNRFRWLPRTIAAIVPALSADNRADHN